MRRITKFKRSVRAISPVIATLLMIAIAVVASLVVYAWVIGYIGGGTTKASNAMLVQSVSHTSDNFLIVYVQNVGQGALQIKQTQSIYVNSVLMTVKDQSTPPPTSGTITFSPGTTAALTTDNPYTGKEKLHIKITATDGTFTEYTTTGTTVISTGTFTASPTAGFTMSTSYPDVGQTVTFTDTSVKGAGTITTWSWNYGDNSALGTTQNPTHSYSTPGTKTVTLTVTDSNSKTAATTHTLVVGDFGSPTASFTFTATNRVVAFTDTSTAGSGTITTRAWDFGDGGTSTAQNPSHTYGYDGQKAVTLTVTNSNGKTSSTTRTVNVNNAQAPTAEFTMSSSNPDVGQTVTFTDTSTAGSTGTINRWSWDFGDSTALGTTQNPTTYTLQQAQKPLL